MYKRISKVIIICSQDMQNQKQTKMALYKDIRTTKLCFYGNRRFYTGSESNGRASHGTTTPFLSLYFYLCR